MVHWGDPIPVDGKRPDWLRDDDVIQWSKHTSAWLPSFGYPAEHYVQIDYDVNINYIRLSVDHPYYVATSKGFTYWPGGNAAPEDWDEGFVLLRQGEEVHGNFIGYWDHRETIPHSDIIGYRKRTVDDETSNHMVAAPAPDIESPMFVPQAPAITPEFIALVVNERDALRKRVTDLLLANNRYVEERRASENWQAAFERSQDDLATAYAELSDLKARIMREISEHGRIEGCSFHHLGAETPA